MGAITGMAVLATFLQVNWQNRIRIRIYQLYEGMRCCRGKTIKEFVDGDCPVLEQSPKIC